MAGLFDQYEQASTRPPYSKARGNVITQPVSSGYVSTSVEDETPIFSRKRITFEPPDAISHMVAANNYLVIAMTSNILFRIDVEHLDKKDEVEVPKAVEDKIVNLFLDPTGRHLLIGMQSGELYYLSRSSKKPRALAKFKGHHVTAVGWNKHNVTESSTGEILIGTKKGLILETEIASTDDGRFFQSSLEKYFKQHIHLTGEKMYPVTGLEVEKIPTSSLVENKYFIVATLPGRLYEFIGSIPISTEAPIFTDLFVTHDSNSAARRFIELPGNFGYSKLQFYAPKFKALPKTFGWMTGPGVLTGDIDVTGAAGKDSVMTDQKLVQYLYEEGENPTTPLSVVMTEFHILVLFPRRLKAICVLNDQLIHDDVYPERFGKLLGMLKDPMKGHIWTYTSKAVFKHTVYREARDVWQMYLDAGQFDKAKQFCKENPIHMDKVLTKQAQQLFNQEKYQESAMVYAQTEASFEEITLKFIKLQQKDALKAFLLKKLNGLRPQDKTQTTMITTWLIEIYLNQLGELRENEQDLTHSYDQLQGSFRQFLAKDKVKECVNSNRNMVYDLIASHGDIEGMIFFAVLMKDYERVISHHLQHDKYVSALEVLNTQNDMELFYKFSPILMQNVPDQTVDVWMSRKHKLEAKKLIPALVQYDHQKYKAQGNAAIRYLEYCIQKLDVRDEAIHNYLLSLYAKLQPDKLMTYLNFQGHDAESICYDLKYALRLCTEHDHKHACVHIYSIMGLYEEAVDLAIQVDIDLAKSNADKPADDEELRKKLWLKIARHVVEKEKDIKQAMEFLHECDLLKIEDVLPFFPDFVTIDHFKDAICTSLQEYNQHIDSLKDEMNEATDSARDIRAEIQTFRNKFVSVKAQDKCASCGYPLMTRAFYVFPCQHRFHSDCLIAEVLPHFTSSTRHKVEDLQRKLASREFSPTRDRLRSTDAPGLVRQLSQRNVKEELDELVAAECVYCGDVMIRCVDKEFLEENEFDSAQGSWL